MDQQSEAIVRLLTEIRDDHREHAADYRQYVAESRQYMAECRTANSMFASAMVRNRRLQALAVVAAVILVIVIGIQIFTRQ